MCLTMGVLKLELSCINHLYIFMCVFRENKTAIVFQISFIFFYWFCGGLWEGFTVIIQDVPFYVFMGSSLFVSAKKHQVLIRMCSEGTHTKC